MSNPRNRQKIFDALKRATFLPESNDGSSQLRPSFRKLFQLGYGCVVEFHGIKRRQIFPEGRSTNREQNEKYSHQYFYLVHYLSILIPFFAPAVVITV